MKNHLFLLLPLIGLFLSCANNSQSDDISDEIKTVETSLTYPVYIYGDSTWNAIEKKEYLFFTPGLISKAVYFEHKLNWNIWLDQNQSA